MVAVRLLNLCGPFAEKGGRPCALFRFDAATLRIAGASSGGSWCSIFDGDHKLNEHLPLLQSPRTKLRIHDHVTLLVLNPSNMFTTVPLSPWPVLSDSHDEQHVVKDRPSLYTTRHFDAVVSAKALGPHSHEVAFSTLWNGRCRGGGGSAGHEGGTGGGGGDSGDGDRNLHRGGGHGDGLKGGRGRGAAGTTQGGAAGAAADN